MDSVGFLEKLRAMKQSNLALREHLTQALVFVRCLAELPAGADTPEDAEFRSGMVKLIQRSEKALAGMDTAMKAPCCVCGVEIAVVCEDCFDEIKDEVQIQCDSEARS